MSLTLTGKSENSLWRLINFKILLLTDAKIGGRKEGGVYGGTMPKASTPQEEYLIQLIQARLNVVEYPLVDIYNVLHAYSSNLTMAILHLQVKEVHRLNWGSLLDVHLTEVLHCLLCIIIIYCLLFIFIIYLFIIIYIYLFLIFYCNMKIE